jgi:hypothetical protein
MPATSLAPGDRPVPRVLLQVMFCVIDTGMDSSNPDLNYAEVSGCIDLPTTPCAQWDEDYIGEGAAHGAHALSATGLHALQCVMRRAWQRAGAMLACVVHAASHTGAQVLW